MLLVSNASNGGFPHELADLKHLSVQRAFVAKICTVRPKCAAYWKESFFRSDFSGSPPSHGPIQKAGYQKVWSLNGNKGVRSVDGAHIAERANYEGSVHDGVLHVGPCGGNEWVSNTGCNFSGLRDSFHGTYIVFRRINFHFQSIAKNHMMIKFIVFALLMLPSK